MIRIPTTVPARLAVAVVLVAGGCAPDQPEPSPEPAKHYLPVPRDLCARVSVKDVADRLDLTVPPWYEPSTDHRDFSSWWTVSCGFGFLDETQRFTTVYVHGGFDPHSMMSLIVYQDSGKAQAADKYERELRAFTRPWQNSPVATVEGWWDDGTSVETVEPIPQGSLRRDPHASVSRVDYFLYHENLYLHAFIAGDTVNSEVGDALPILYGVMDALIEETKTHLRLVETG